MNSGLGRGVGGCWGCELVKGNGEDGKGRWRKAG
jgi:hypothetical protein